jgi:hypothetical protein
LLSWRPQDYHRFHSPVDGKVVHMGATAGSQYWTVNPIAINSVANVFGENVRTHVSRLEPWGRVRASEGGERTHPDTCHDSSLGGG